MAYSRRRAWARVTLDDGSRVVGQIPNGASLTDDTLAYTLPPLEGLLTEVQAGNYMAQPAPSGLAVMNLALSLVTVKAALLGGIFKTYSFEIEEDLESAGQPSVVVLSAECTGILQRAGLATFTMGAQEVRGINLNYRLDVFKLQEADVADPTWDIDVPKKRFYHLGEPIFPGSP